MIKVIFYLILKVILAKENWDSEIYQIPVYKNISNISVVKCSQMIDSFEYIQLETNDRCLIGNDFKAQISKDKVLIYKANFCYVFELKTGKFLYEVGKWGRGPGEFQYALQAFDPNNSVIYSSGWNNDLLKYTIEGKLLTSFPIPNQKNGLESPSLIFKFHSFPDSKIVGYSTNMLGPEKKLLTIFDEKGQTLKIFPNKNVSDSHPLKFLNLLEAQFYSYKGETYFKELYNDTVYKVTENELIPHIVFNCGKSRVPYFTKWESSGGHDNSDLIFTYNILENDLLICLKILKDGTYYFCIFNKATKAFKITTLLENDIDDFLPFKPEYIDLNGNFIQFVEAIDVRRWLDSNKDKGSDKTKDLRNISSMQNPILIIGRTKE